MKFTRRNFLKTASLLGVGLTFIKPSSVIASKKGEAVVHGKKGGDWTPSICNFCSTVCSIKVFTKGEGKSKRITKIEGNEASDLNRGKTCARGNSGLYQTYDPDRIKTPLIRVEGSKRGEWKFKKATWDEAFKYIGNKLEEHKIQPWEFTMSGGWTPCVFYMPISLGFAIATQVPNIIAAPFQHCVGAGHVGNDAVLGSFNVHDEVLVDWENTKYALLPMVNAGIAGMSTSRAIRLRKAIEKGAEIVVLDPRKSELASKATEWLPIKPGTDQALFLAIFSNIMRDQSYDKDFVRSYTNLPFLSYKNKKGKAIPIMEIDSKGIPSAYFVYDLYSQSIKRVLTTNNQNLTDEHGKVIMPALHEKFKITFASFPKDFKVSEDFKLDPSMELKTSYQYIVPTLSEYTSKWAAKITEVSAEKIDEITEKLTSIKEAAIDPGWMGSRYKNVLRTRRLQTAIQTLIGGIDRKGGWIFAGEAHNWAKSLLDKSKNKPFIYDMMTTDLSFGDLTGLPFYIAARDIFAKPTSWATGVPAAAFVHEGNNLANPKTRALGSPLPAFSGKGLKEAIEGTLKYKKPDGTVMDYKAKAIYFNASNPVRHYYTEERWVNMISHKNMKLVIAVDILPTDTNKYADVILPGSTYLERNEPFLYGNGPSHDGAVTTRFKAIEPLYDSRETPDILFKLVDAWTHQKHMEPHMKSLSIMMRDGFKKMLMPEMMGEMLPKMKKEMVDGMMKNLLPLMTPQMMRDMVPTLLKVADDKLMNSFKGLMTPEIMAEVMPGMDAKSMDNMMNMMNPSMMKSMMPGMMKQISDKTLMEMAPGMMSAMSLDQMAALMPGMMPELMKKIPADMMAGMEKEMFPLMPKNIQEMMKNPMSIIDSNMHYFGAMQMMTGTKTAGGKPLDAMKVMEVFHKLKAKGEKNPVNEALRIISFEQASGKKHTGKELESEMREKGVLTEHHKEHILEELNIPRKLRPLTLSGRMEVYSELFQVVEYAAGIGSEWNPMFEYIPAAMNQKLAKDEFFFIFGKIPQAAHASTTNNPILNSLIKRRNDSVSSMWISTKRGKELGIKTGDRIELTNTSSNQKVQGIVKVTEMVRDDSLFFPAAFGVDNPMQKIAYKNGPALNKIVNYNTERLVAAHRSQEFTVKIKKVN